ncbi:MAG: DUF192 domain-containing protein [Treponema sp.]|jgi:uncharacterized membrane protein (UPF0127 family)|nr:DUF192 domain-containing protein [Treponema sp.]
MEKKLRWYFCFFFLALFSQSCSSYAPERKTVVLRTSAGSAVPVSVELALTPEEQQNGFMNRRKIPDGTGMLFVFKNDQILNFWMKNTPTPLSIAYIDANGKIRDIFAMQPYSLAPVTSTVSVRYALEVPQGWFKKSGISIGDMLELNF